MKWAVAFSVRWEWLATCLSNTRVSDKWAWFVVTFSILWTVTHINILYICFSFLLVCVCVCVCVGCSGRWMLLKEENMLAKRPSLQQQNSQSYRDVYVVSMLTLIFHVALIEIINPEIFLPMFVLSNWNAVCRKWAALYCLYKSLFWSSATSTCPGRLYHLMIYYKPEKLV